MRVKKPKMWTIKQSNFSSGVRGSVLDIACITGKQYLCFIKCVLNNINRTEIQHLLKQLHKH